MYVAEQTPLLRLAEARARSELGGASDVVEQRGGQQQVAAQPLVQLCRLAADRRDADRVLEQPAGVRMVRLRGREPPERRSNRLVVQEAQDRGAQARMRDLGGEELEKAFELVRVAPNGRRQVGRIGLGRRLERAHVDLQPVAELLHAAEHTHGISLAEPRVEQLDVVPDSRVDPAARVDELEGEIRRAVLRPQPLLARDGVDALDDTLFGELRDRAHSW